MRGDIYRPSEEEKAEIAHMSAVAREMERRCIMEREEIRRIAREECQKAIEELPNDHKLLLYFTLEELASPALIRDPALAKATPCTCFTYKGKDFCWSKGAIGLLKQEQVAEYCVAGKTYKETPGIKERWGKFAEAAESAHKRIEAIPKGERLSPWLEAMSEELGKRGIEV